jgi:hypothetical protein
MVACDLALLERWLTGWSLSRGLPVPYHAAGGLAVDVGFPNQLRRHVFADAGPALQACANTIHTPFIYLKAAVHADELRRVLDARWVVEAPRSMMIHAGAMAPASLLHVGYRSQLTVEHGGYLIRILNAAMSWRRPGALCCTTAPLCMTASPRMNTIAARAWPAR